MRIQQPSGGKPDAAAVSIRRDKGPQNRVTGIHASQRTCACRSWHHVFDIEQRSDAVRDLRTSYFYSGDPGVFLFGGLESDGTLWDFLFQDFWNVDVNCNGQEGDLIVGLNQKLLPDDLVREARLKGA